MKEDEKWQALLSMSAPTFAGENTPPYGFITRTVSQLKAQRKQQELVERIGLRAFLASLAILFASACVTLSLSLHQPGRGDLEPGIGSLIQVENFQVS